MSVTRTILTSSVSSKRYSELFSQQVCRTIKQFLVKVLFDKLNFSVRENIWEHVKIFMVVLHGQVPAGVPRY